MIYLFVVAAIFLFLYLVRYFTLHLSREHGGDIRVVWYFFSLSLVVTFVIALWAVDSGAITEHGTFQGGAGEALQKLLHFMLDLNADIKILVVIFAFIVLPQVFSYVLSGLSGCASNPLLIRESFSFFVWGLIKAFAGCAGIISSLSMFGLWKNLAGWSVQGAFAMLFTSVALIFFSFLVLFQYRAAETVAADIHNRCHSRLVAMHRWFTRAERQV